MNMIEMIEKLAIVDTDRRRSALINILRNLDIPFEIETLPSGRYKPQNIRVRFTSDSERIVIGAHYDSVEGSTGSNDNASGIVALIHLIQDVMQVKYKFPPIEFVFFDLEEAEMQGSLAYVKHHNTHQIRAMINVDLCGVGDVILVAEGKRANNRNISNALVDTVAITESAKLIACLPPSDDLYFEGVNIPTISVCCVPHDDVAAMEAVALAMHGGGTVSIIPAVFETMHNRSQDSINYIDVSAIANVRAFIHNLLLKIHQS